MYQWLKYAGHKSGLMLRFLAPALLFAGMTLAPAYAHFFGATQEIGGYQVVFAPYPQTPVAGANSTLNFSVLENGSNIFNVYAAVVVANRTGEPVHQEPYRPYEISDITVPYVFEESGDYVVTVMTRIPGHEKYQAQPLTASFDVSAGPPGMPLDELMLYYVTPAAAAITGISVYLYSRGRL
jgi:hypothetical protein